MSWCTQTLCPILLLLAVSYLENSVSQETGKVVNINGNKKAILDGKATIIIVKRPAVDSKQATLIQRRSYIVSCCGYNSCIYGSSKTTNVEVVSETATTTLVAMERTDPPANDECVPSCREPEKLAPCTIDRTRVNDDGTLKISLSEGIARVVCGRLYMLSWFAKTREDAQATCCSLNMTLVSMEDATKSECLSRFYKTMSFAPTTFWSSGSDGGCPGKWIWCNTGETFAEGIDWAPGQPKSASDSSGNCVESSMSVDVNPPVTLLKVKACDLKNKFICQKAVPEPANSNGVATVVPPVSCVPVCRKPSAAITCSIDTNLVKPDGSLSIPFSMGISRVICGRLYYLSWVAKTREEAERTCCSLNMTLVSMEDATKSDCLANYYKMLAFSPTTFWTSGSDEGCPGQWTWCNTGSPFASGVQWAPGQPKSPDTGKGNCIESAMAVDPPATQLAVKACADTNKFICQKALPEPASAATTTKPPVTPSIAPDGSCNPICPPQLSTGQCKVDARMFAADGTLSIPFSVGISRTVCGRLYMLSWIAKSREEAELTCCSLNMTVVSMEDATKSECLANFYKTLSFLPTTFWSSGTDGGCSGKWIWCNSGSEFAKGIQWAPGQPKATGEPMGNCVESQMSVNITPPVTLLSVKPCSRYNKFICQKPDPPTIPPTTTILITQAATTILPTTTTTQAPTTTTQVTITTTEAPTTTTQAPTTTTQVATTTIQAPTTTTQVATTTIQAPTTTTEPPTTTTEPSTTTSETTTETTTLPTTITETTTTTTTTTTPATTTPDTTTGCPPCTKDISLLNNDGDLLDPLKYGRQVESCNFTFLFSDDEVSFRKAISTCCKLNMNLAIISGRECATKANKMANISYNVPYWTAFFTSPTNSSWRYCSGQPAIEQPVSNVSIHLYWDPKVDSNQTNSAALMYMVSPTSVKYVLRPQTQSHRFVCWKDATLAPCSTFCNSTCAPNTTAWTGNGNLADPTMGQLYFSSNCGAKYLFSNQITDWKTASKTCCLLGMNLVTVADNSSLQCVKEVAKAINYTKMDLPHWTSGAGQGTDEWTWCQANATCIGLMSSSTAAWSMNTKPLVSGVGNYITVYPINATLNAYNGTSSKYHFICCRVPAGV